MHVASLSWCVPKWWRGTECTCNVTQTRGKTSNIRRLLGTMSKSVLRMIQCLRFVLSLIYLTELALYIPTSWYQFQSGLADTQSRGLSKPLATVQTRSWFYASNTRTQHGINSNKRGGSFDFQWISTIIRRASLAGVQPNAKGTRGLWLRYARLQILRIDLTDGRGPGSKQDRCQASTRFSP